MSGNPVAEIVAFVLRPRPVTRRAFVPLVCVFLATAAAGCNYTFQAGAGLPPHVQTLAILPFENETGRFELTQEVHDRLLDELPRAFGVNTAGEEYADAIVRGSIRSYSVETPSYRAGQAGERPEVIARQVSLTIHVQVIDRENRLILWDDTGLTVRGEYAEDTQLEEDGRAEALDKLAQTVIDGIQSNW